MINFLVEIDTRRGQDGTLRFLSAPLDPLNPAGNNLCGKPLSVRLAVPDFTVKLSEAISGVILHQTFSLTLANTDGFFDGYGMDDLFNVPVRIKKATVENPGMDDFIEIRRGLVETVRKTLECMEITATDKLRSFEEPVCDVFRKGDFDDIDIDDEIIGREKPVIYGEVITDGIMIKDNSEAAEPRDRFIAYYIAENVRRVRDLYDREGKPITYHDYNAEKGILRLPEPVNSPLRELGSLKAFGGPNTIGRVITDLLERKSGFRYNAANFDMEETNNYRERSAPINIKFTGGEVKQAVETCLKSDMAYLIQKNDGRLTVRRYRGGYAKHDIPAWALTQKPAKDYDFAQKMFFSSCVVRYDYDYIQGQHRHAHLNDKDEANQVYDKIFRMFFETYLSMPENATGLSDLLSGRFNRLHETVRLGVGVDTAGMNLLDTVRFEGGIDVNGRKFSRCENWVIREINPSQDKLVLEELKGGQNADPL